MKAILLAVTVALVPALASAGRGDMVVTKPSAKRAHVKGMAKTIIVRIKRDDPTNVAVMHSQEHLKKGTKIVSGKFQQVALNSEKLVSTYDHTNEMNISSTASWYVGFYNDYYSNNYYGNSYYRPYNYRAYGWARNYGYAYYPSYRYYGNRYNYSPYYGYSDEEYDYALCDWY